MLKEVLGIFGSESDRNAATLHGSESSSSPSSSSVPYVCHSCQVTLPQDPAVCR